MTLNNLILGSALVSVWTAACGGQLPGNGPGSPGVDSGAAFDAGTPIDFVPGAVYATRFASVCGVTNPPFAAGDLYSLQIVGAMTAAPFNSLDFSFTSPAPPVGRPISLSVMAFTPQGTGVSAGPSGPTTWYAFQYATSDTVRVEYSQGTDPAEIDTGAFDAAFATLVHLPVADGQPFTVRLQIHFADGKVLDQTFSSPLTTSVSGCPAG